MVPVENCCCDAVDDDPKESKHTEDFVHGALGDKPFLEHVGDTVESGASESEEVPFEHCWRASAVGASEVVRNEEETHTTTADENADNLSPLVANAEDEEGDDYNADDGPEVEELGLAHVSLTIRPWKLWESYRQKVGVSIRQHSEVVTLDIQEAQNNILPPVNQ